MAWRAITEADILTRMSGAELEAFREAVLDPAQPDPIADAVAQATALVRGAVAMKYVLGAAGTVPASLIGPALDILIIDIQTRAGGLLMDPNDARREKAREARRLLERVARGDYAVEDATGGDGHQAGPHGPLYTTPSRSHKMSDQAGI